MTLIQATHLVLPEGDAGPGWLRIEADRIASLGTGRAQPSAGEDVVTVAWLTPGFVDIHSHGGGGASVIGAGHEPGRSPEEHPAATVAQTHLKFGTTSFVASLVSGHPEALRADVLGLADACDAGIIAGIHLEGPWISPTYKGAHDPTALRAPELTEVNSLIDAGRGHIRMVTIAPELPGAIAAIGTMTSSGVTAAIGHTNCTYAEAVAGIEAGATVATHLYNAMRPLNHREPGPIAALTEDPRVINELVLDGVHVHSAAADLARRASEGRIVLVTDAMAAAGSADGRYMLGELEVDVVDSVARLVEGGAIAGSTLTLDNAVKFAVTQAGFAPEDAIRAATSTAAACIGIGDVAGSLIEGRRADLVALDDDLNLVGVWFKGERQ